MIARCDACGREYLETDARRVAEPRPRCVSCLIDEIETDAETRGQLRAIGDALRAISSAPLSWCRQQTRG